MKSLVVGNWKLYINSIAEGKKLLRGIDKGLPRGMKAEVVVCPQIPLAVALRAGYGGKRITFGTQDAFTEESGAHTGEASPRALVNSGLEYVIIGHAERRLLGDTDEIVAKKAAAGLAAGLRAIVCVGELERDQEGGHFAHLAKNVKQSLARIELSDVSRLTIAYDPLWAIGNAEPPSPRIVAEAVMFIRKTLAELWGREKALKVRIIYGGSVNAESAEGFVKTGGVQGFLIGRASVDPQEFTTIIRAWK